MITYQTPQSNLPNGATPVASSSVVKHASDTASAVAKVEPNFNRISRDWPTLLTTHRLVQWDFPMDTWNNEVIIMIKWRRFDVRLFLRHVSVGLRYKYFDTRTSIDLLFLLLLQSKTLRSRFAQRQMYKSCHCHWHTYGTLTSLNWS